MSDQLIPDSYDVDPFDIDPYELQPEDFLYEEARARRLAGDEARRIDWTPGEFDDRAWRRSAACRDRDPAMFFPVGVTGVAVQQIADAKSVCRGCPVRLVCLQYALTTSQESGVWGGYDEEERRNLRRTWRKMGRPVRFVPGAYLEHLDTLEPSSRPDQTLRPLDISWAEASPKT